MPSPRSDALWTGDFRLKYSEWWPDAKPLLESHQYIKAYRNYPWPAFDTSPWTPLSKPLSRSRLAVVTTGGLYRPDLDEPFDDLATEGNWSFRALPRDVEIARLAIAHSHFPHEAARADMNTIFPLERLAELEAEGVIGSLAQTHFSMMGYITRAADVAEETAPAIASRMKKEGVDVALVVPV